MAYYNNSHKWYGLDNAAIIVPGSTRGADTRVFRMTCQLKEEVAAETLQEALDQTLPEFPYLNSALRKGLFWYYLEGIEQAARVTKDTLPALSPLYFPGRRNLLYRVTYYHNRINLEMFHALADGTGALVFFRKLLTRYLSLRHHLQIKEEMTEESSASEKAEDSFAWYYKKERTKRQWSRIFAPASARIKGERDPNRFSHLTEGIVSARAFIDLAHGYQTTVGVLITALFIRAVGKKMSLREREKHPIVISVPVNLRRFFPSRTIRNFFGVINIPFDASKLDGSLDTLVKAVDDGFHKQLTEENVRRTMNFYSKIAENYGIKLVPLFLKEPVLALSVASTRRGVTATVSNLEQIRMPEEVESYVDHFAVFMAASNAQLTIATYGDKLCFGCAGSFVSHDVMLEFYRSLVDMGLSVELSSNDYDLE